MVEVSHVIGEVAGVTVGTFAGVRNRYRGQLVQLTLPTGTDLIALFPTDALRLATLLVEASARASGDNRITPPEPVD